MLDIPSQYIHYCVVVFCGNHCVIVYGLGIIVTVIAIHLIHSAPTQLKTRVNRGNRDIKYDLCIKVFLKTKK